MDDLFEIFAGVAISLIDGLDGQIFVEAFDFIKQEAILVASAARDAIAQAWALFTNSVRV